MKSLRYVTYLGLSGPLLLSLLSAAAHAESLDKAVENALTQHPSVKAAIAAKDFAGEEKREEFSGYFPDVSITGTGGRMYSDNSTSRGLSVTRGAGYSYLWEGTVTARQMIFDGFGTQSRVGSAAARKMSADLNLMDVKENAALNAARAYIDVLRARKGLEMLKGHESKVDDYLSRIKSMVDEGAADEADYQQGRDIRVILDGLIDDYAGQVKSAESYYFEAIGRLPDGTLEKPAVQKAMMPEDVQKAVEYALQNHPLLKAAEFSAKSIAYDGKAAEAALYPALGGELSYLKSDKEDIIGGEVEDARAVVRLNWNFETGGGQLARIRKAKYQHKESKARAHELKGQIERGVRLAWSEYETARNQTENQAKRVDLNRTLMDTFQVQFDGARITLLQLMQSDNQAFTMDLEQMNGEYRLLTAEYALLASLGRLQESMTYKIANAGPPANDKK